MLGSPRSEVTGAAGLLRKSGLISYSQGEAHHPRREEARSCRLRMLRSRQWRVARSRL